MNLVRGGIQRLPSQERNLQNVLRTYSIGSISEPRSGEPDKLYKVVELELKGNDAAVLNSIAKFATLAGQNFNINCKSWNLRKPTHERFTVLKSAHVHKKHRVQYEIRTYFTFVQFQHLTGSTASTLLEYIERNLPEGVALKATKVELQKLPEHFIHVANEKMAL